VNHFIVYLRLFGHEGNEGDCSHLRGVELVDQFPVVGFVLANVARDENVDVARKYGHKVEHFPEQMLPMGLDEHQQEDGHFREHLHTLSCLRDQCVL
jgi:hypothetical protein